MNEIIKQLTRIERRVDNLVRPEKDVVPAARVYRNSIQSIPNAAWTAIQFSTERFDYGDLFTVASPTRLTANYGGVYSISGHFVWDTSAVGIRLVALRVQGVLYIAQTDDFAPSGAFADAMSVSTIYKLSPNQYVELVGYQNTGGALNSLYISAQGPELAMARVRRI